MKNMPFITCVTALLLALTHPAWSESDVKPPELQGVIVYSFKDGILSVDRDSVAGILDETNALFNNTQRINTASLQAAWRDCYSALFQGNEEILKSYFRSGVPNTLKMGKNSSGRVVVRVVSKQGKTIRLVLTFEILTDPNTKNIIYDAHVWSLNEAGKWEVESLIY